ncbi:MAG: DinB family protein [Candidatus Dormibacteria bacterium]
MAADHRGASDDERVVDFLRGQRETVLAIVAGLDEKAWHRSVVPTGWTPAGMLEHLGGAEWHWFQGVVAGKEPELPDDLSEEQPRYDPQTVVFTSDEPSTEVIAFYRDQCAESDAVLATTPLSARPRGKHGLGEFEPPDVRWVVLHMIEETARHAGHLDIARELLDGRVRLGGR